MILLVDISDILHDNIVKAKSVADLMGVDIVNSINAIKSSKELRGDLISRQAVLDELSELNAVGFYEAQEDSKEAYYEIRNAIKNL